MIEAEHSIAINTNIDRAWNYVQDIRQWAMLFPGCKECDVIDENNSKWIIKVGAGGLVKTVNVLVHIEEWAGPERVNFSYKLENEPVIGSGSYIAAKKSANQTEISLKVRVEGSGPMAPMWEAMCRPLLPQLAKVFSEKLKSEIEALENASPIANTASSNSSLAVSLMTWLRNLWRSVFHRKPQC
ncbi:MAG: SRPBCC family protein [Spongiibacteraceae bacterium]